MCMRALWGGGSMSHQHDEAAGAWGGQEVCILGLGPHSLPPYNDSVSLGEGSSLLWEVGQETPGPFWGS